MGCWESKLGQPQWRQVYLLYCHSGPKYLLFSLWCALANFLLCLASWLCKFIFIWYGGGCYWKVCFCLSLLDLGYIYFIFATICPQLDNSFKKKRFYLPCVLFTFVLDETQMSPSHVYSLIYSFPLISSWIIFVFLPVVFPWLVLRGLPDHMHSLLFSQRFQRTCVWFSSVLCPTNPSHLELPQPLSLSVSPDLSATAVCCLFALAFCLLLDKRIPSMCVIRGLVACFGATPRSVSGYLLALVGNHSWECSK